MVNGWLITLGLVNAYVLLLVWLHRNDRMERWNLSLMLGFILMIRTQRGRRSLEILARPKRLWNVFGDLGVFTAFAGMAAMTVLMIALVPRLLRPDSGIEPLGASEILVIPGVNPFVPLWYGIIALIVTLVVHEGGHGVLALANNMRVKTLGLLYAVIPIGAFVEPDEDDLMESPRRKRLRVYAAGAMVNFVVALVTLVAFAGMVGAIEAPEGAPLIGVTEDAPADLAGIMPGDVIVAADGNATPDWQALIAILDNKTPGQNVSLILEGGAQYTVTLDSRWDHLTEEEQERVIQQNATLAEELQQDAFLGVSPFNAQGVQDVLAHPFQDGSHFLTYISLPIGEIRDAPVLSFYLPEFYETPFEGAVFWPIAMVLFWVFWINLMVGLTNILPMLPLDGGHLFRDGVAGLFDRMRPAMDKERRDRIVGRLAGVMSLVILAAFLLQIIGPRLV